MTDACDARCELYELANAQLEDRLTAEQGTRLEGLVLGSHSLRRQDLVYMEVNAAARWIGRRLDTASPAGALPLSTPVDFPGAGNDIANQFPAAWPVVAPRDSYAIVSASRSCSWQRRCFRVFDRLVVAAKPAQPPVLVAGQYTQNVAASPAAGPSRRRQPPASSPAARPADGRRRVRAPETMHVRSAGGRESRIPLPAGLGRGSAARRRSFLSIDSWTANGTLKSTNRPFTASACSAARSGSGRRTARTANPILTEKAGATSVARRVRAGRCRHDATHGLRASRPTDDRARPGRRGDSRTNRHRNP